jgi:hypothetical protein
MATIESLDLAGLQYNPDDVAAALADLLTVNGVTLTDIISSLESSSATQFVSKYDSTTNVLDNITLGNNVSNRGAVKFVSAGKPAVNLSGTAGVDYPAEGHTWVCYAMQSGRWRASGTDQFMAAGFGAPVLTLTNDGSWGAAAPAAWTVRDIAPDGDTTTTIEADLSGAFAGEGTDGISGSIISGVNYTYTLDFENLN